MIISISGAYGSGKDTLASYLIQNHGFIKGSFSAAVKDVVSTIFGWDRQKLEGTTPEDRAWRESVDQWWTEEMGDDVEVTPRWAMETIASHVMRDHFHYRIWSMVVDRWLSINKDKNIVFTDTRFFNEFMLCKTHGAKILGVYRKVEPWLAKLYEDVDDHLTTHHQTTINDANLESAYMQEAVKAQVLESARQLKLQKHESELVYLFWNKYDGIIDNTGTVENSIEQLKKFL